MDWIIKSRDEKTGRVGERHFDTQAAFISAAQDILGDLWQQLISATLPDGTVLDEERLRQHIPRRDGR
jgi:hypothetical protein